MKVGAKKTEHNILLTTKIPLDIRIVIVYG